MSWLDLLKLEVLRVAAGRPCSADVTEFMNRDDLPDFRVFSAQVTVYNGQLAAGFGYCIDDAITALVADINAKSLARAA